MGHAPPPIPHVTAIPTTIRTKSEFVLMLAGTAIFAGLWISAQVSQTIGGFDISVVRFVAEHRTTPLVELARGISLVGSPAAMYAVAVLSAVWISFRRRSLMPAAALVAGVGGISVIETTMKWISDRPRPPMALRAVHASGMSFPSGHASISAATAAVLIWLMAAGTLLGAARVIACSTAALIVAAVGLSRIVLGVHYPTDVLAGWALAAAWVGVLQVAAARWAQRACPGGIARSTE